MFLRAHFYSRPFDLRAYGNPLHPSTTRTFIRLIKKYRLHRPYIFDCTFCTLNLARAHTQPKGRLQDSFGTCCMSEYNPCVKSTRSGFSELGRVILNSSTIARTRRRGAPLWKRNSLRALESNNGV